MPQRESRVGIVMRTKNRPWFLRRALQDLQAQRLVAWELCIVNDGGRALDVDEAVSELPEDLRSRVLVIHNVASRGRSAAANQGVRALGTEYYVLHDDDDLWHPDFLALTVQYLDENPADIGVVTRTEIVHEVEMSDGGYEVVAREPFWADLHAITYTAMLEINRWVPIAYVYRAVLHERIGFYDERIHAAEDWDFGLRTLVRHQIGFIDGVALAYWMQRAGVEGDAGNSMFVLAGEHQRYDALIRDNALRDYVALHGSGLALYLSRYVPETVRSIVREELVRELDARPSDVDRVRGRLRRLFKLAGRRRD